MNMTNSFNQKKEILQLLMREPNITEQQFEKIFDLLKTQADDRFDAAKVGSFVAGVCRAK